MIIVNIFREIRENLIKIPVCLKVRKDDESGRNVIVVRDRAFRTGDSKIPNLEFLLINLARLVKEFKTEMESVVKRLNTAIPMLMNGENREASGTRFNFQELLTDFEQMDFSDIRGLIENPGLLLAHPDDFRREPARAKEYTGEKLRAKIVHRLESADVIFRDKRFEPNFFELVNYAITEIEQSDYENKLVVFERIARNSVRVHQEDVVQRRV